MTTNGKTIRRVRANIASDALYSVSRFFNATLSDILLELFQNSRRAQATRVDITTCTGSGPGLTRITVADDGVGIEDPATVLFLGESRWDRTVMITEHPDGVGLYALAGREVRIASTPRAAAAWTMTLRPENFDKREPADVIPTEPAATSGTIITFETDEAKPWILKDCVSEAAKFQRVPVYLNNEAMERGDINDGAFHLEPWGPNGCVVFGVHVARPEDGFTQHTKLEVSGHPVPLTRLGTMTAMRPEDLEPMNFYVTAKVDKLRELKLLLPARKAAVENDFLTETMRPAAIEAIYRGLAANADKLGVAFTDDNRRRALENHGITLPEPRPRLMAWGWEAWRRPTVQDVLSPPANDGEPDADEPAQLIVHREMPGDAPVHDTIALLEQRRGGTQRLLRPEPCLVHTPWYQAIPVMTRATASLLYENGVEYSWDLRDYRPTNMRKHVQGAKPDRILIRLESHDQLGKPMKPIEYETTWLTVAPKPENTIADAYRETPIAADAASSLLILTKQHKPTEEMYDTLTRSVNPHARNADEVERMRQEWRQAEMTAMHGAAAGLRQRLTAETTARLVPLVPTGTKATITIDADGTVKTETGPEAG